MRKQYRTVISPARVEIEERRSRFIAICQPLASEEEALAFVSGIRDEFPDATHHVYAWILGGERQLQRYSDDGEPQGTAGLPVLDVLRKAGVDQAGIVVTRYFGGVRLGTGGLARAYGKAAAQAMAAAGITDFQLCHRYRVTVPYGDLDRLRWHLNRQRFWTGSTEYGLDAILTVGAPEEHLTQLLKLVTDLTAGAALIEPEGAGYIPLPPPDPPPA